MNEKMIKALVEAGAVKKVYIIAAGSAVHVDVDVVTQNGRVTATTLKGSIKTWATIDSSARWVRALGVGRVQLDMAKWLPGQRGLNL